ncbi:MAG: hypothetical protein JSS14_27775 [Proteobacteria bacterium]|nr:hypothetical protein [Pseudomonadota bacterium]
MSSKKPLLALLIAGTGMVLQACGGGSDGSMPPPPRPDSGAAPAEPDVDNSRPFKALFKPGKEPRYQLVTTGYQSFDRLGEFEQDASGAVTRFGDTRLAGERVVDSISGDETFALGRWAAGNVVAKYGADSLTGNDRYHYLVFNVPDAVPRAGTLICDDGNFSTPSLDAGPSTAAASGSAKGRVSVTFTSPLLGMTLTGAINVDAGGDSGSLTLDQYHVPVGGTFITHGGGLVTGGVGAAVALADAGNGAYQLVGSYRVKTQGGASYLGVFRLACE